MPLDPGEFTVSNLSAALEGLSRGELEEARELEVDGKNRVTALEAIDGLLELEPEPEPAAEPEPAPVEASFFRDARGWGAQGDGVGADLAELRFGSEVHCRAAIQARE